MYAYRVGGGGGDCGPGNDWECDSIDEGVDVGQHTSLSLTGADYPEVAYYDGSSDQLKHAIYTAGTPTGCSTLRDGWVCSVIDTVGGRYASADRDSSGYLHIAYHDQISGELRGAQYWGPGGNCGLGLWRCSKIDTTGTSTDTMGISLVVEDKYDYPFYAYQHIPGGPETAALKVVSYDAVGIVDPGGNCTNEGEYVSVDASPSGLVVIAYYESDTCADTGRLKVAHYPFHEIFLPLVLRND